MGVENMEIKEPVAIFTAEGFKMLIDALQGKKVDLSAFTGESPENEIDSFIDGYEKFKAEGSGEVIQRPNRTPEEHYQILFDILEGWGGPMNMAEIRSELANRGITRDPKSYSSLMQSAMKRFPIEKFSYGSYGVRSFDGGNENE